MSCGEDSAITKPPYHLGQEWAKETVEKCGAGNGSIVDMDCFLGAYQGYMLVSKIRNFDEYEKEEFRKGVDDYLKTLDNTSVVAKEDAVLSAAEATGYVKVYCTIENSSYHYRLSCIKTVDDGCISDVEVRISMYDVDRHYLKSEEMTIQDCVSEYGDEKEYVLPMNEELPEDYEYHTISILNAIKVVNRTIE